MVFILYRLGNNDEEGSINVHYRCNFPPNTFNLQLIESNGAEPDDTESKHILTITKVFEEINTH